MRGPTILIAALIIAPGCSGCLATPNLAHPGTEAYQQARARVFEPYPENEPGPPIVGGRPREYQDPTAEINRVKPKPGELIVAPSAQVMQQPPIAQPPIVTGPPAVYCPPVAQPMGP